jgi:glycosyltransferase involved in cell wall biosynthesis
MSQVPSYAQLTTLPPESGPARACRDAARPRCSAAALRILFLTRYGRLGASSRQRCYAYLNSLRAAGVEAHVSPFLGDDYVGRLNSGRAISLATVFRAYTCRLFSLLQSHRYDLLWIEKEALPWIPAWAELGILRLTAGPIIIDYDDAIFHRYDQHSSGVVRRLLGRKIDRVMAAADLVAVGNGYLGLRAREAGAREIAEIPTVVDLRHYTERRANSVRDVGTFTLGWIGSPLTSVYLEWLRPALGELASRIPFRIILVGASPTALAGLPVERVAWSPATEAAQLARFDVGLMPLPDLPWERGKCAYKLIQYMASWLPVIASPVGANRDIVVPGETGFLAGTDADWVSSLSLLAENPELRRRIGSAGRRRAEERYSLEATAPKMIDLFYNLGTARSRRWRSIVTGHDAMPGPDARQGPV